jgi:hypothetical protein
LRDISHAWVPANALRSPAKAPHAERTDGLGSQIINRITFSTIMNGVREGSVHLAAAERMPVRRNAVTSEK